MKKFISLVFVNLLFLSQANAMDAKITSINNENTHNLKDLQLQCGKVNYGSNIVILQDGVKVEIPLTSIKIMRSLQNNVGFYIETTNGKELTNCHIACPNYEWVGKNDFGGRTSIDGEKWHLIELRPIE